MNRKSHFVKIDKDLDSERGLFKLILIIIIGIIILSYFGVDADAIVESKPFQTILNLFISFWK